MLGLVALLDQCEVAFLFRQEGLGFDHCGVAGDLGGHQHVTDIASAIFDLFVGGFEPNGISFGLSHPEV